MCNEIARALRFIQEFQKVDPFLSVSTAHAFLIAAVHEGETIACILQRSPVSRSAFYRAIADLCEGRKIAIGKAGRMTGHGLLVTRNRPEDQREREVFLTARGRALVVAIVEIMERP
jgi:DNA-binding MarR family transcriptional regulator